MSNHSDELFCITGAALFQRHLVDPVPRALLHLSEDLQQAGRHSTQGPQEQVAAVRTVHTKDMTQGEMSSSQKSKHRFHGNAAHSFNKLDTLESIVSMKVSTALVSL